MKKLMCLCMMGLTSIILAGCGVTQSISEGTASVAKSIFVWDVRTLHLDFTARAELNTDDNDKSSPVVIRIYQLTEPSLFQSASYPELADTDQTVLATSLLASKEIVLKPEQSISVDVPFDSKADYVGIVALFKDPDLQQNNWRLVLKRRDLNINSARKIEVNKFSLTLIDED